MRRRLAIPLTAALLALAALPSASAAKPNYLKLARDGVYNARTNWWNPRERWYNDRLGDQDAFPLATTWSLFPLFEAIDGVQIAQPSAGNKKNVRDFAAYGERYFNPALLGYGGYSPYPGDRGTYACAFYDDNSWWGLGYLDAYRATHNKRWINDAKRASDFVNARAWDPGGGGMWWNTGQGDQNICRRTHSLEALAASTALAAEIYQYTNNTKYRDRAKTYIAWADSNATNTNHRGDSTAPLYTNSMQPVMTYVEGAMIGAHLSLCKKGDHQACRKVERLARGAFDWWQGRYPNFAPQFDNVFFRYMAQLAGYDHKRRWWDWANTAAKDAIRNAHDASYPSLYLRFWDGSAVDAPQHAVLGMRYGQIQTDASPVALFAWLADFPRP